MVFALFIFHSAGNDGMAGQAAAGECVLRLLRSEAQYD